MANAHAPRHARMALLAALLLAIPPALAGCARPTDYTAAGGGTPYGYSEEQVDQTTWRIRFAGNSATAREQVESMLLFRAAELTRERGAGHFALLDQEIERDTSYRGTGAPAYGFFHHGLAIGPYSRFRRPHPYSAYGFGFPLGGTTHLQPVNRYTGHATVRLFDGTPPAGLGVPYDAEEVLRTIGPSIRAGSAQAGSANNP